MSTPRVYTSNPVSFLSLSVTHNRVDIVTNVRCTGSISTKTTCLQIILYNLRHNRIMLPLFQLNFKTT